MDTNIKETIRKPRDRRETSFTEAAGLAFCVMLPAVTAGTFGMVILATHLGLI